MVESRCGLLCSQCSFRETMGCEGCVNIEKPFWADSCPVKSCCEEKEKSIAGNVTTLYVPNCIPLPLIWNRAITAPELNNVKNGRKNNIVKRSGVRLFLRNRLLYRNQNRKNKYSVLQLCIHDSVIRFHCFFYVQKAYSMEFDI